jgi:hypothetical protein
MSCMTAAGVVDYSQAGHDFKVQLRFFNNMFKGEPITICEHAPKFIQRWFDCFQKYGNVEDAPRAGRPPKVPDAEARVAAEILCAGYPVTINVDGHQVVQQKHYTTLPEAINANPRLSSMLQQYDVTSQQLLNAIHRVAPEVKQHRVSFRHLLTDDEKAHRWNVAASLRARHLTDSTLLDRMVFIDETTILTHGLKREHIEVWVNTSDTSFKDYTGVPGKPGDPVKAHVIAAVSAHPVYQAQRGVVYMDFTTGTSDIKRLKNLRQDGSTTTPYYVYTVSVVTFVE